MATNIAGVGTEINIVASSTFPSGFVVTQFGDDADPIDIPTIQIADKAMGLNGDLLVWGTANPISVTINVVPGSDDDENLAILAEANRVGRGKSSAQDSITATISYANGNTVTLTDGAITDAMAADSIASAGRKKTKEYSFSFENKTET